MVATRALDELIARNDVANQARADIHLALHNNASACHCTRGTEMYTHFRPQLVTRRAEAGTVPARRAPRAPDRQRPATGPSDVACRIHPSRRSSPITRGHAPAVAAAVGAGRIALPRLAIRASHPGSTLRTDGHRRGLLRRHRSLPRLASRTGCATRCSMRRSVAAGRGTGVTLRLTNSGNRTSSGWRLVARVVQKVPRYDGRPGVETSWPRSPLPDGLAPGQSVESTAGRHPDARTRGRVAAEARRRLARWRRTVEARRGRATARES